MNLNNFFHLPGLIVNNVKESTVRADKNICRFLQALFARNVIDNRSVKNLPTRRIVQCDQLPWQVSILDLKQSDIFSAACNQRILVGIVESNVD